MNLYAHLPPSFRVLLRSPDEVDPKRRSTYLIAMYGGLLAIVIHITFLLLFRLTEVGPLYTLNFFSIAIYLYSYYLVRVKDHFHVGILIAVGEVLLHQGLAVYYLGWDYGFQYYLLSMASFLLAGRFRNLLLPLTIVGITALLLLWLYFVGQYLHTPHYSMGEPVSSLLYTFNLTAAGFLVTFFAVINELTRRDYERQLLDIQSNLYRAATTDELTGLYNRRRTQEHVDLEMARVRRAGAPFVLAIGDIDNFKLINDEFGHEVGDIVLRQVATTLREGLRDQDVVGRWGGEEFVLLLPHTSLEGGLHALEKVRAAVAGLTFEHGGQRLTVSMTFGATQARPTASVDALLSEADHALYRGKHAGKNCVVSAVVEMNSVETAPEV